MKKIIIVYLLPFFVFAADTFRELVKELISTYFQKTFVIIAGLSFFFLLFSIFRLLTTNDKHKEILKNRVMWAFIAFIIFISFFGIVSIFMNTFELDNTSQSQNININFSQEYDTKHDIGPSYMRNNQ